MTDDTVAIIIQKVPYDDFDMSINWGCPERGLNGDTVTTSTWSVYGPDNALTLSQESIVGPANILTQVYISAGTLGNYYVVINNIVSSGGRKFSRCFLVKVVPFIYVSQSYCI